MKVRFEGRVAFVTGAGSGIGRVIAEGFAAGGGSVVVNDLDGEAAEATTAELPGKGHFAAQGDVTDPARMAEIFEEIDAGLGRVDVLVNNAGVDHVRGDGRDEMLQKGEPSILNMSLDAWSLMLSIHLNGSFICAREAARRMIEARSGSIINISSIAGLAGMGLPHYATAKGGLLGFTRSLARELGRFEIRVNSVCPGVIDTPMTQVIPKPIIERMVKQQPLQRQGRPEDIAEAVLYFASDAAAFITGQALSPNGGVHIA
jgi:3-oxoacyl-[acyl-carrier protein] reductase